MAEYRRPRKKITTELPSDILFFNVLLRLPAKSILRFRYVSKQWHSILTSPEFLNMHLHHVTNDDRQNHHKLLVLSRTTPCNFHTIDCESPEDGVSVSRPLPFEVSPKNMSVITSFNGLVCVGITKRSSDDKYSDLMLWNPLTGDYKRLHRSNSCEECYEVTPRASALYYTSYDDDFKLLRVTHNYDAYIYSLKSDSWRKLGTTEDLKRRRYLISESWVSSTVLNEKVYFLKRGKRRNIGRQSYSVIRFDTKTEKFTKISTPSLGVGRKACLTFTLLIKDRKIHLCVIYYSFGRANSIDLRAKFCRMDGDRDWTKVVTYQMPKCLFFDVPLHLMRNDNWFTYSVCHGFHVYNLDIVRHLNEISYSNMVYGREITPRAKYIETLVSPNRWMK
ncbi:hypothetical protein L1887_03163 [Cichorium endivia]|nr:hypothetical protein L1887_03163 [Cichorium endivia]